MEEESDSEECQCCQKSLEGEVSYELMFIDGDIELRVCLECYLEEDRINGPIEDEMGDLAEELENLTTK